MMKVAVFHFHPVEYYPPLQNLLEFFEASLPETAQVRVYTTEGALKPLIQSSKKVKIVRLSKDTHRSKPLMRYMRYLSYYLKGFFLLLKFSPAKVLYFESLSSLAPYLYKQWINRKSELYIHYHEYMTPQEYRGMWLNKVLHRKEKRIYHKVRWLSHTNEKRLSMFLEDIGKQGLRSAYVLPNYPPGRWINGRCSRPAAATLRLVYIGSFDSIESLYIREFLTWIAEAGNRLSLDIYSFRVHPDIVEFIASLNAANITIKGTLEYADTPKVLSGYDVGIILYKCDSKNVKYCAPNKLFEYLACGLDVWFPVEMSGVYPYIREGKYPKLIPVDYRRLDDFRIDKALDKTGLEFCQLDFSCEQVNRKLLEVLTAKP